MFIPPGFSGPTGNRLLAVLSADEHKRLLPHLKQVYLPKNKILYEVGNQIRYAYFLLDGPASPSSDNEHCRRQSCACSGPSMVA